MRMNESSGGVGAAARIHLLRKTPRPAATGPLVSAAGRRAVFLLLSSILLVLLVPRIPAMATEDVVTPNENLVADGLPPIPKALAERVAAYTESRGAVFEAWHPVRREMLIGTRFADVTQVHRVKFPGGARTQLTFYPERTGGARFRPLSGDGFVFNKDVGGGEWYQLFWRDEKSGKVTMVTDGKSRNTGGDFSHSGKWLAYQSTRRNGKDNDIWVVDPADAKTERKVLEVSGGGWGVSDWSPDDKTLLVGEYLSANESRYWLVDAATGAKSLATPESKEKVAWGRAVFAKDGKSLYTTTDSGAEFHRLVSLDLASKKITVLTPGIEWDVSSLSLSEDGGKLAFVVNEGGVETLHVLDTATRKEVTLPKIPLGTIGAVRFHANGKDLAFTLASARSASDVYSIDMITGPSKKVERWTESELGGLDPATLSEPEKVSWKSFDGRSITGFLYRPPASFQGPRPVIINIHGGPEGQYQPGFLGRNNFYLNELGVALIFPNVRGSSGFGKTFLTLDNAEKREDSVKDIGALLDWIAAQPFLDKSRVMVAGGSYGGYMTLASMTHYNDRFRCAVDVVGISSWVTFLEHTEAYRRDLRRAEYGDERDPKMRELLLAISPLTNAGKITKPMFIVQGRNDPRVPYTEAEQMVTAIKRNGGPVWYLLAKDEGHGFSKKKNQDFQFLAALKFVEDHLLK
jgi:dipeptidyl aminopeptidase/acylaminoacyl peptidase